MQSIYYNTSGIVKIFYNVVILNLKKINRLATFIHSLPVVFNVVLLYSGVVI